MCGICGFTGQKDDILLKRMSLSLAHRGPDDEGLFSQEGASLGHRRLSIIDLSKQGQQPMSNENATVWVVTNGEIYNFKELRQELAGAGHTFHSHSDSETIVHGYEEYGEDFVLKLDGMFAIALWDAKQKKIILARDRIGIKPLYYAFTNEKLLFASEIKSILQDDTFRREINHDGFFQYLAFQCILTDETMFKGIYKLEPGSMLIYQDRGFKKRKYWSLDDCLQYGCDDTMVTEALRNAVQSHLVSDVPIGVLLSGGLDSSSIVAIMHEQGIEEMETFTVGFNQPDDEFVFAREVANRFRTRHHELIVTWQDLSGLIEKIVWHMDEPLADGATVATYLAAGKVREFVKVVLVGEGGDEALAGYNWHKLANFPFNLLPEEAKKKIYFYFTTFYKGDSQVPFDTFLSLFEEKKIFLDAMSIFEIKNILPNSLLMKVDKMTMAHALEARVPFLDYKFLSVSLGLNQRKKISLFSTKIFLRRLMYNRLPQSVLMRRKHGFIVPIGRWLENELHDFAHDIIFSREAYLLQVLPRQRIEALFRKQKGLKAIENNALLWKLLIFELWQRKYLR